MMLGRRRRPGGGAPMQLLGLAVTAVLFCQTASTASAQQITTGGSAASDWNVCRGLTTFGRVRYPLLLTPMLP